jgi:MSHA pilin protein MshA
MDSSIFICHSNCCKGISLVMLVVMIAVVGMFAAFAMPSFTNLDDCVRASEVRSLSVRPRNAASQAHAQYVNSGATISAATSEGGVVQLANGYPDAGSSGIACAIADLAESAASYTPTSVTYSKRGARTPALCSVTYLSAPSAFVGASITDINTGGCSAL